MTFGCRPFLFSLPGVVPADIGKLVKLTALELGGTEISGKFKFCFRARRRSTIITRLKPVIQSPR